MAVETDHCIRACGLIYGQIAETMQINKETVGRAVRHLRLAHTYRYTKPTRRKTGQLCTAEA